MPSVSFVLRSAAGNSNDTSDTSATSSDSVSNINTATENENSVAATLPPSTMTSATNSVSNNNNNDNNNNNNNTEMNENSKVITTLPVPSVMTLMTLKRRQGTTTRTANISSTNNNDDDDDIKSMVEIINKTVASSTSNSTVAPPDASSTTQPPTKKKKTEQHQLVWAKDGVDSETAELHPAYLLKNGNETCQIRWTSNGVVATVPKSRISFDLPTRRRKKSDSSKKGESSRRSSAAANSKSGNATATKDNNNTQKRKVSFEQAAELTRPASSSSSEDNDGCEEQNAELILLQTKVEKLTKELASTRAMSKSSIEEAQATIDEYEPFFINTTINIADNIDSASSMFLIEFDEGLPRNFVSTKKNNPDEFSEVMILEIPKEDPNYKYFDITEMKFRMGGLVDVWMHANQLCLDASENNE